MRLLVSRRRALWLLSGAGVGVVAAACHRADAAGVGAGDAEAAGLRLLPRMAPRDFAGRLDEVRDGKLDLLHVGPAYLFGKVRIPHARHAGEASTADGYAAIVASLRQTPLDREVVVYCGCCPTKNCPNIVPTERAAREVGLRRVSVLDLPTTLKADWTDHGYPVERG